MLRHFVANCGLKVADDLGALIDLSLHSIQQVGDALIRRLRLGGGFTAEALMRLCQITMRGFQSRELCDQKGLDVFVFSNALPVRF